MKFLRKWFRFGSKEPDGRLMDPNDILYSIPTLCDPGPPVSAVKSLAKPAKQLHEDDWRQIEFVAGANEEAVIRSLAELEFFKKAHEVEGGGWKKIYLRPEHGVPLAALSLQLEWTNMRPLGWGRSRVERGFAVVDDGSDWFLYGYRSVDGALEQLAVCPGEGAASVAFANRIFELVNSHALLLVDWYGVRLVDTSSPSSILEWTEGYD